MIEDALWTDIFKMDIVEFTVPILVVLAFFRILSHFRYTEKVKIFVYIIKALVYGYLVVMMYIYFLKDEYRLTNINVFTGFTFLFSATEVVDNISLAVEECLTKSKYSEEWSKEMLKGQEKNVEVMHSILMLLKISIRPGRVNKEMKKIIIEFVSKNKNMSFHQIDSIIEAQSNEKFSFSNALNKVQCSEIILKILKNEEKNQKKSLSFNKNECDELIKLIDNVLEYMTMYSQAKHQLKLIDRNIEMIKN